MNIEELYRKTNTSRVNAVGNRNKQQRMESISGRNAMMYVISIKNSNNFDITWVLQRN